MESNESNCSIGRGKVLEVIQNTINNTPTFVTFRMTNLKEGEKTQNGIPIKKTLWIFKTNNECGGNIFYLGYINNDTNDVHLLTMVIDENAKKMIGCVEELNDKTKIADINLGHDLASWAEGTTDANGLIDRLKSDVASDKTILLKDAKISNPYARAVITKEQALQYNNIENKVNNKKNNAVKNNAVKNNAVKNNAVKNNAVKNNTAKYGGKKSRKNRRQ